MRQIKFLEQTTMFAESHPEYKQIPAFVSDGENGQVAMCWKMSAR
jgi:hypothetical protein